MALTRLPSLRADLPLPQITSPPFPTIAQVNAGSVWAPNTATYRNGANLYLTAWSCLRVVISGTAPASVVVHVGDNTFALTQSQGSGGAYSSGAIGTVYTNPYGCTGTGVTAAALLVGTTFPNAGYANVNLSNTPFAVTVGTTYCAGAASCTCTCNACGGPLVACPGLQIWTNQGSGVVSYSLGSQAMVLRADGNCGGFTLTPSAQILQLDGTMTFPTATPACGGVTCGTGATSCWATQVNRSSTLYPQTFWVSGAGLTYLPLVQQTALTFPTLASVNTGAAYAPNTAIWTVSARQLTAWSCVRVVVNAASGAVYIDATDRTFAWTRDETAGTYAVGAPNAQFGIGKACTGATTVATLLAGTSTTMGYANVNLSGTAFMVSGSTTQCAGAASCTCSCNCNGPIVACPGWSIWTGAGAGAILYSPSTQSLVALADGNCGGWLPSPNNGQIPLDGFVLATPSQTQSLSQTQSQTGSGTRTMTSTPSSTSTASQTQTWTQTQSPSVSLTASLTQTSTQTQSATQTMSASETGSPSETQTNSVTQSTTLTHTPSLSQSSSVTPSSVSTPSVSQSPTVTQSSSVTSSSTSTPSTTQTPSPTLSPSGTPSSVSTPSGTQSTSQGATLSSTASGTQAATGSQAPTPTATGTPSTASTPSQTLSISSSQMPTPSSSQAASVSQTQSPTVTTSVVFTATPTISWTATQTQTQIATLTSSGTQSPSQVATASSTPSGSQAPTGSNSQSPTLSGTLSGSQAVTSSMTQGSTPSGTLSVTPSLTSSRSQVETPSASGTPSVTSTSSSTPSQGATSSATQTPTGSQLPTPTQALSVGASASQAQSGSVTQTPTVTVSGSQRPTMTQSPSLTSSPTATATGSGGATRSASQLASPSPSSTSSATLSQDATLSQTGSPVSVWTFACAYDNTHTTTSRFLGTIAVHLSDAQSGGVAFAFAGCDSIAGAECGRVGVAIADEQWHSEPQQQPGCLRIAAAHAIGDALSHSQRDSLEDCDRNSNGILDPVDISVGLAIGISSAEWISNPELWVVSFGDSLCDAGADAYTDAKCITVRVTYREPVRNVDGQFSAVSVRIAVGNSAGLSERVRLSVVDPGRLFNPETEPEWHP